MWLSVILKAPLFASHMRQFSQQALHNRLVSSIRYRQNCRPLIAAVQQIKTFHKSVSLSSLEATAPQEKQPNRQRISRKVLRKRRPLTAAYDDQPMSGPQIVAIAVAESFDLSALIKNAQLLQVYQATCVDEESDEGLHFVPKEEYLIDKDAVREFFVFTDGVVVFWGMESAEVCGSFNFARKF
ncbi:unnamed protein product [Anisakis simplex]|uniref:Required for meiotic nuclear division protein 1 homolog (inferred by orthology to a human protein) n=1 Tax=Anisakis simplex TaxID=6269 RepID=A0A0M3K1P8_ANISI|nr:unnamed protein product [Anisakis simplex]